MWQAASTDQLHFLRNTTPYIFRSFSASNQHSFTVSYLVNSCGLSPETAISASGKIRFENPKNPDSVLALLRNSGCTNTHITKIVTKLPSLLLVNPEKTLLPKLEFFRSMDLSGADLASILSSRPSILRKSLRNVLIPKYNFLKSLNISNEDAVKVLKRSSWSSSGNLERTIAANIAVLREIGVPISHISFLVARYHSIGQRSDKFSENVKTVVEMGFNPLKFTFLNALQSFCQMTESTRQQKMEMYRGWGWSEDEILLAFRTCPQCMQLSENKVTKVLDFLVNKMGWQPAVVARAPIALCLNFEKRVVPRCSVVKVLLLKGLVKKDLKLGHFLSVTEGDFVDKYETLRGSSVGPALGLLSNGHQFESPQGHWRFTWSLTSGPRRISRGAHGPGIEYVSSFFPPWEVSFSEMVVKPSFCWGLLSSSKQKSFRAC
ncbi:hypothetical protein CK203_008739 [Vitis vinifera]|uniref:Transcription termination factor MTERF6, chloroplastic/mitochondrial n=1 Tax=Vitis vinifera TaxID=29760 RepID=A0A438KD37_VITVI|nr:hypothetical protein CK203_008739 [Vitis vinifera]